MSNQDPLAALDAELAAARLAMPDPTSLDDLDAMIAKQLAANADKRKAQEAKKRLVAGGRSAEDINADAAILAAWEAAHVWTAVANVAQYTQQRCLSCGEFHYHFIGLAIREDHRTDATAQRWTAIKAPREGLPNEVSIDHQDVPQCAECLDRAGFSWDTCYYRGSVPEDLFEPAQPTPDPAVTQGDEPSAVTFTLFQGAPE